MIQNSLARRYRPKVWSKTKQPNGKIWVAWGIWDNHKERFIDDYDPKLGVWWTYVKERATNLSESLNKGGIDD